MINDDAAQDLFIRVESRRQRSSVRKRTPRIRIFLDLRASQAIFADLQSAQRKRDGLPCLGSAVHSYYFIRHGSLGWNSARQVKGCMESGVSFWNVAHH